MIKELNNLFCGLKIQVQSERKVMNDQPTPTQPTTAAPTPTTSVESKPADQTPAAPEVK